MNDDIRGARRVSEFGIIIVSIIVLLIYLYALYIASLRPNDTMLITLIGVAATNFTTAVGFWLGSSYGSAKKTDQMADMATKPAP